MIFPYISSVSNYSSNMDSDTLTKTWPNVSVQKVYIEKYLKGIFILINVKVYRLHFTEESDAYGECAIISATNA